MFFPKIRTILLIVTLSAVGWTTGCGILGLIGQTRTTTVELRNNGDFPVSVVLFYDDEQDTLDGAIQETGTERTFTIDAGQSQTLTRACDDLQAVIIDDADLEVVGSVGPEDRSDLLRDGDQFRCGDTIVFTFDHSDNILDFDVTVNVTTP
jgi:hypothetical protein